MANLIHGTVLGMCLMAFFGCNKPHGGTPPAPKLPAPKRTASVVQEHNRAVALMGKFDYAEAHTLFDKLADENPNWQNAKIDLAIATLNRQQPGDDKAAAEILETVLQNQPDSLRAKYCRGILYLYASEPESALKMFQSVATADPTDAYALYYTGQCHFQLGNFAQALRLFASAQKTDPYLRSAYYGAFQASQQLDNMDAAQGYFEDFQKLENNPQGRLAEIKYTRMGPKAEVHTIAPASAVAVTPKGPLFAEPLPLRFETGRSVDWCPPNETESTPTITACDLNQDGKLDLFICNAFKSPSDESPVNAAPVNAAPVNNAPVNAVLLANGDTYELVDNHPLAKVHGVNAALWGDIDNDGLTDVYFCCNGPNQLWQQLTNDQWLNVTAGSKTSGGSVNTVDGACFDADHDGDLDLFLVNDGPNELLNNNLDGTFRTLAAEQGIAGNERSRGIVLGDFDNDRDVDLLVVNEQPPHEAYRNDRLWNYVAATGFDVMRVTNIWSAVSADVDSDGKTEIFATGPDGITRWSRDENNVWGSERVACTAQIAPGPIAVQDISGDGQAEIMVSTSRGWAAVSHDGRVLQEGRATPPWTLAATSNAGYSILSPDSQGPVITDTGGGRFPMSLLRFSGKENKADQMRTNASGIGVQAAIRVGCNWTSAQTFRSQSGVGQSLQPVAVGLRGKERMDFVSVRWPDGVFQSETDLAAGTHLITETQRQVSSCPIVFAWNGAEFQFITDILGVGGIGFNHGRGEYHPPRPWENLLIPDGTLKPIDGQFVIKLAEPMEEVMYLDAARLVAYDLPANWNLVLDERMATNDPQPTGEPHFYKTQHRPTRATNHNGADVTDRIRTDDGLAAEPGTIDRRFLGRTDPHGLTLEFNAALDQIQNPVLVFDGWVEYPYSQTMFSAWQANAKYESLTLEARSKDKKWTTIYQNFGYMAGMPRRSALPIDRTFLPAGTYEIRLTSNLEMYIDAVSVIESERCDEAVKINCELTAATVSELGFPKRANNGQKRPSYQYSNRVPLWDTKHLRGPYSRFGDAFAQVVAVDDESSIVGPGEEIELRFTHPPMSVNSGLGKKRKYVLETHGWCKDRDLFTQFSETVKPIPVRADTKKKNELIPPNPRYRD